jgi:hypothetical protein
MEVCQIIFYQSPVISNTCSTKVMFYQSHVLPKSGLLQNGIPPNSVLPKSCSTKVHFTPKWDSTQFRFTKVSPAVKNPSLLVHIYKIRSIQSSVKTLCIILQKKWLKNGQKNGKNLRAQKLQFVQICLHEWTQRDIQTRCIFWAPQKSQGVLILALLCLWAEL